MLSFLEGKKTHILALLGALASFAFAMDWITLQVYMALAGLLGFGATATLRHGIQTDAAKVLTKVETVEAKVAAVPPAIANVSAQVANVNAKVVQATEAPSPFRRP